MANVLITGCSSGIGLLAALHFAREGDRVHATMRDPAKGGPLTDAAAAEGLDLRVLPLDVLDDASVHAAVEQATAEQPLDVLVNNAGIELRSSIEDADDDEVRRQFDTNVFGLLRVTRAVLPAMRERGRGTIVNVSSVAGIISRPFGGLYSASKHAVEAISEALHFEVKPFGVRVAMVEPGQFATSLLDNALVARRFDESSPYWKLSEAFDVAVRRLVPDGEPADPRVVAVAIREAALGEPEPRLQRLVGDDAELIVGTRRAGSFEDYERAMRGALDWWD